MKRLPLITCSALLGLAAGFGISALLQLEGPVSPDGKSPSSALAGQGGAAGLPASAPGRLASVSSALADKLRTDLSLSHGVTRWLLWMTAVEKAGPKDFPQLARMAQELPGALNMLGAHWIDLDPAGLFAVCRDPVEAGAGFPANELAQLLMETWPKKDPDAVLAALRGSLSVQMGIQFSALNTLFDSRPEQALILMSDLGIESYGPHMRGVEKWAAADPKHAAEVALAHPAGYASQEAMKAIAKVWADSDAAGALAFAASQNSVLGVEMANQVLSRWVEKDLDKASDWLATADGPERARLLPAFIESWGRKDAPNALQWCLANTSGSQQSEVINSLVKGTATQNAEAAAAMVTGLEASPMRAKAAVAFAQAILYKDNSWWPGLNSSNRSVKPEAIAWLGQLDAESRKQVISHVSWTWGEQDPKGFAEYLRTPAGQDAGPEALSSAARNLVREQPVEALEWASQVPEESRKAVIAETFQAWTRSQPDAAMDWLRKLPVNDPRRETLYLGAIEHAIPPGAFQTGPINSLDPINNARQSLAKLLATDPAAAQLAISKLTLSDDQRSRVLSSLKLASAGGKN
ncbi:MAG: hypothetical protein JWM59_4899 [Verrucomicrobiales bacterium]|nr:hypothetical protein [Verrucomicrobiales bacterium]